MAGWLAQMIAALVTTAVLLPPPARAARSGLVRASGRALVDEAGPYLGVGTSLFWAPWGYLHDRERLKRNLACAAGRLALQPGCPDRTAGVDFIRVLLLVGPGGWRDRTVTNEDVYESDVLTGLSDLAYNEYGLRVGWTIFGSVESTPTASERERLVAFVADALASRADALQFYEVANEATLNGFAGESGRRELWSLARVLRQRTPNLVALTSPQGEDARVYYRHSPATLVTNHVSRDVSGPDGLLGPIRAACAPAIIPALPWVSNEPIGPQSSVESEDDPARLALAAAYTWLCGGAAYVLHTGAGIRGGGAADRERGRSANLWEIPRFAEILGAISAVRRTLPVDLPNFRAPGSTASVAPLRSAGGPLTMPCAVADDGRMVCVPIGISEPMRIEASSGVSFDVRDATTGERREQVTLGPGESHTLAPTTGVLVVGQTR